MCFFSKQSSLLIEAAAAHGGRAFTFCLLRLTSSRNRHIAPIERAPLARLIYIRIADECIRYHHAPRAGPLNRIRGRRCQ